MFPFWILLELRMKEVVMTTGAIRGAELPLNRHHQQTNTQFFYRPDVLPVTQPTVSEHWREVISHSTDLLTPRSPGSSNHVFDDCRQIIRWLEMELISWMQNEHDVCLQDIVWSARTSIQCLQSSVDLDTVPYHGYDRRGIACLISGINFLQWVTCGSCVYRCLDVFSFMLQFFLHALILLWNLHLVVCDNRVCRIWWILHETWQNTEIWSDVRMFLLRWSVLNVFYCLIIWSVCHTICADYAVIIDSGKWLPGICLVVNDWKHQSFVVKNLFIYLFSKLCSYCFCRFRFSRLWKKICHLFITATIQLSRVW